MMFTITVIDPPFKGPKYLVVSGPSFEVGRFDNYWEAYRYAKKSKGKFYVDTGNQNLTHYQLVMDLMDK